MTFEINESLTIIKRHDYGILDWLSDIGGLYKILQIGTFLLISLIIEDGPALYLTTTLISRPEDHMNMKRSFKNKSEALRATNEVYGSKEVKANCCIFMRLKLGRYLCCSGNKKDRFVHLAYKNVLQEFNISNLYKRLNVFEGAIK